MVKTDTLDRAVPWTRLILSERQMPNDLNLRRSQRLNAALAALMLVVAPFVVLSLNHLAAWVALAVAYLTRNWRFYSYLASGQGTFFALRAIPLHWLYFIYSCAGFGIGLMSHLADRLGSQRDKRVDEQRAGVEVRGRT
jgi:hypothetical protein